VAEPSPVPENPYEAPAAEATAPPEGAVAVPPGFFGKFGLAVRLLLGNLPLVAAVVLTVWLPANALIDDVMRQSGRADDVAFFWQVNSVAEAFLGPIVSGALITLLAARMEGRRLGYRAAMGAGLRCWGRLFGAWFLAGFFILLGLVALVIPGLVLAVRYALIDPVVVLEGEGPAAARTRSAELVRGRGWQVAAAWLVSTLIDFGVGIGLVSLPEVVPGLDSLAAAVAIECAQDLVATLLTVWLFLYYWEASRPPSPPAERDLAWMRTGPGLER
jgi:hypothetical protein